MRTLGIISMKGGVGKTTLAANLAAEFARLHPGPVAALDLDPQNGLAWHFSGDAANIPGICETAVTRGDIGQGWLTEAGVTLFPYGPGDENQRMRFEGLLESEPDWLARQVRALETQFRGGIVVIDTPPGHSVYLHQAMNCADQLLMVALPDMASLATVADMESILDQIMARRPHVGAHYLFNQTEPGQSINDEVTAVVRNRFGPRLLPNQVHRDESIAEALACHTSITTYDPASQGAHDMTALAQYLLELLPG